MINPLGKNIILKGTTKTSKIASDEADTVSVDSLVVFKKGPDVIKEIGINEDVCILRPLLQQTERLVIPDIDAEPVLGEFYLTVLESEIIGIYE